MRLKKKRLAMERLESRRLLTGAPHDLASVGSHELQPADTRSAELRRVVEDDHGDDAESVRLDDHGNDAFDSTSIAVNEMVDGELEIFGDVDWFGFTASAGERYRFSTHLNTLSDSVVRLIDSDGYTTLARNDDFGGGLSSQLDWMATRSGQYYLEVYGYGNSTGRYELHSQLRGDIDRDGVVGILDIDRLYAMAFNGTGDVRSDLNDDQLVDTDDVDYLVRTILRTNYGDADLDGDFDSSDLVQVFTTAEYQDDILSNSSWAGGDWNGDGEFDSSDLVMVFTHGFYGVSDDAFEDNDTLATAADLGVVDVPRTIEGLKLIDSEDWYRFRTEQISDGSGFVSLQFEHSNGDLDIQLFDAAGELVRQSTNVHDFERVSLDGLSMGAYYLRVYGYEGARNDSYAITIDPGQPISVSGNSLWLNFDGASISTLELSQWSTDWALDGTRLDPERDGIHVDRFLAGTRWYDQREDVIRDIIAHVQHDVTPYGISVQRWDGSAVVGRGDTTIFIGNSTLDHPHVAGDIDFGNNNLTDIAFVGNEWWGDVSSTALALADVVLHEAGHTYGLFHVDTRVGGDAMAESMGLRYSEVNEDLWVRDTRFIDRTFVEYRSHGGGRGSQNSHRTLLRNFGLAAMPSSSDLFRYSSDAGVFSLVASSNADSIQGQQLSDGVVELDVNGHQFLLGEGVEQVRIYTNGDARDHVQWDGDLGVDMILDPTRGADLASMSKVADSLAAVWNGTSAELHRDDTPEHEATSPVQASTRDDAANLAAFATHQHVEVSECAATQTRRRVQPFSFESRGSASEILDPAAVDSLFDESERVIKRRFQVLC